MLVNIIVRLLSFVDDVSYWPCDRCVASLALATALKEMGVLTQDNYDELEKWLSSLKKGRWGTVRKLKRILRALES